MTWFVPAVVVIGILVGFTVWDYLRR